MNVHPTRVKMEERVRMALTATRVLVQRDTPGRTVRQVSKEI